MSLLLGTRTERLPLDVAVDQLSAAARWAGAPSVLWIAGVLYPGVVDAWSVVRETTGSLAGLAGLEPDFAGGFAASWGQFLPVRILGDAELLGLVLAFPFALVAARLSAGLARKAGEEQRANLESVWSAGEGATLSTFCLWLLLAGMLVGALVVLVLPLVGLVETFDLDAFPPLLTLLATPALAIVFLYAGLLHIVHQLALHSLVCNDRGVASALSHGWRLVRNAPWSAVRAASCDLVLVLLTFGATLLAGLLSGLSDGLALVFVLASAGFVGTVRAAFWGRVYRALGGPVPGDPLHGLGDT